MQPVFISIMEQYSRFSTVSGCPCPVNTVPWSFRITITYWPEGEIFHLLSGSSQSNFSRSNEHAPLRSTCTRHANDAAVPAPYLTRPGRQTHAKTYARPFGECPLPTQSCLSTLSSFDGRFRGTRAIGAVDRDGKCSAL